MSVRWLNRVFDHSRSQGMSRLVLVVLADAVDDDGVCWPSLTTLARKAQVHRVTIIRHLAALRALGEVSWQVDPDSRRGSNIYRLTIGAVADSNQLQAATSSAPLPPQLQLATRVVADSYQGSSAPLPPSEPSRNHQRTTKDSSARARAWPDDFRLTDKLRAFAHAGGLDADAEFAHFRDHHQAKGSKFIDWPAAFRVWCRRCDQFPRRA